VAYLFSEHDTYDPQGVTVAHFLMIAVNRVRAALGYETKSASQDRAHVDLSARPAPWILYVR